MKTVSVARPGVAVFSSTASVLYYVHCAVRVIFSCTCQYTNGSEAVCFVANRELPKRTLLFQVLSLEGWPPSVTRAHMIENSMYTRRLRPWSIANRFARCLAAIALAHVPRFLSAMQYALATDGRTDGRASERASEGVPVAVDRPPRRTNHTQAERRGF